MSAPTFIYNVSNGNIDFVAECLLNGVDVNRINRSYGHLDGYTALTAAASSQKEEMVEFLLRNGADPNKKDDNFLLPLEIVIVSECRGILTMLLYAGAHVTSDLIRMAALHDWKLFLLILSSRSDAGLLDLPCCDHSLAYVNHACAAGQFTNAKFLMACGAVWDTKEGQNPHKSLHERNLEHERRTLEVARQDYNRHCLEWGTKAKQMRMAKVASPKEEDASPKEEDASSEEKDESSEEEDESDEEKDESDEEKDERVPPLDPAAPKDRALNDLEWRMIALEKANADLRAAEVRERQMEEDCEDAIAKESGLEQELGCMVGSVSSMGTIHNLGASDTKSILEKIKKVKVAGLRRANLLLALPDAKAEKEKATRALRAAGLVALGAIEVWLEPNDNGVVFYHLAQYR